MPLHTARSLKRIAGVVQSPNVLGGNPGLGGDVQQKVTQSDLARAAGVAVSTVSRALADAPGISAAMRRQIRRMAQDLGYKVRGDEARGPVSRATAFVTLSRATGSLAPFYEDIVAGLIAEARASRLDVDLRLIDEAALDAKRLDAASGGAFLIGIAALAFDEVVTGPHSDASIMLRAMRSALGENDMMAYLAMMAVRLIELHRVLKPTGSIYLHCDPTASHYLKIILDGIFGPTSFLNEVIWKRSSAHTAKRFAPVHDTIFFYAKSDKYTWNQARQPIPQETIDAWYNNIELGTDRRFNRADLTAAGVRSGPSGTAWRGINVTAKGRHWAIPGFVKLKATDTLAALDELDARGRLHWPKAASGTPMLKRYLDESPGVPALDVISDIAPLNNVTRERLGYPTQKPLALLERFVSASTNPDDVVLDPFCGCGTTVHAAQKLGRAWIGIDITHLAVALIERRLADAFAGIEFDVHGVPKDHAGAHDLARRDKHEFQKWITGRIGAQPYKGGKKGLDRGIDGYLHFRDADKKPQFAVISVKGGGHKSGDVRDLKGTMEREKAALEQIQPNSDRTPRH